MKKLLLFAAVAALFTSCSDDDNADVGLAGTWKVMSMTSATPVDINMDGTASTNIMTETGCFNNMTFVFSGSNNVVFNGQEVDIDASGNTSCNMAEPAPGIYVQDGNSVVVTVDGEPLEMVKSGDTLTATIPDEDFGSVVMVIKKQ